MAVRKDNTNAKNHLMSNGFRFTRCDYIHVLTHTSFNLTSLINGK